MAPGGDAVGRVLVGEPQHVDQRVDVALTRVVDACADVPSGRVDVLCEVGSEPVDGLLMLLLARLAVLLELRLVAHSAPEITLLSLVGSGALALLALLKLLVESGAGCGHSFLEGGVLRLRAEGGKLPKMHPCGSFRSLHFSQGAALLPHRCHVDHQLAQQLG